MSRKRVCCVQLMFDVQAPTSAPRLEVRGVECVRSERTLFQDLSFGVGCGEALYVQGANGVGKSSLLKIISGLSLPAEGEVLWRGIAIRKAWTQFCSEMSYLGHAGGLKGELSLSENLAVTPGLDRSKVEWGALEAILDRANLLDCWRLQVGRLSAGQRQRAAFLRVILRCVDLWVLDEPVSSLDVKGIEWVSSAMDAHLHAGGIIVFTSHQAIPLRVNPVDLNLGYVFG